MSTPQIANQHHPNPEDMLTAKDVALILNISVAHAYYVMHNTGKAFYVGRSFRIRRKDLDQFVEDKIKENNSTALNDFLNPKKED